jgi:aryl sulfotransferase
MSQTRIGWLASYPRSGNTWLRLALEALIDGHVPDINEKRIRAPIARYSEFDELLGVESSELTDAEVRDARPAFHRAIVESADGPLILRKAHEIFWRTSRGEPAFPADVSLGAVYIVRDPRDVAVSFAAFRGTSIDEAIAFMANPDAAIAVNSDRMRSQFEQPLGTWSHHTESWLTQAEMPIYLLRYEDMLASPAERLARVARFLGLPPAGAGDAAEATRFEILRAQEEERGFDERPGTTKRFFRQGRAGNWRGVLTAEQLSRILRDHAPAMERLGYL